MLQLEDITIGDVIRCGFGIYTVLFVEENEYCDGGYGIATEDGYYFSINECLKIKDNKWDI